MSSFPPTVDIGPLTSRPKEQPRKWPILPAEPPLKDYSIGNTTIPTRSHQAKQPTKQARLYLAGLPSNFASLGKNSPNNAPTPRATRAQLLAGLRVNPKNASGLPPVPNYNQPKPDASLEFGNIHVFNEQDLGQQATTTTSDWDKVDPAHRREDRDHAAIPPRSMSTPPAWQLPLTPTVDDDNPAVHGNSVETSAEQERRHRRLERNFSRLFVRQQQVRQQGDGGGGYPDVQVHQLFSSAQQDAISRQQHQQQLSQHQQSVCTPQERQLQFPQVHQAVAPQQQQQQIPQIQQAVVAQRQQPQVQQNIPPRKQQQQPQQFSYAQNEAVLRDLQQPQFQQEQQHLSESQRSALRQRLSIDLDQQQQQHQLPQVQPNVYPRQQQDHRSQVQQNPFSQQHRHQQLPKIQQAVMPQEQQQQRQQQQHPIHQPQQGVLPQQQQQQQQPWPPVEVQPGLYIVYDPATQGYKYACEPVQSYGGGGNRPSEVTKPWANPPKYPKSDSKSINRTLEDEFPAAAHKRYARLKGLVHNEEQEIIANQARMSPHGSSDTSSEHRQGLSPSHERATLVGKSETTADAALKVPQCASLGPDTVSSIEADEALQSLTPTESMSMPTASQTAVPIFSEVREELERLQADIEDLSDGSDSSTESSGSDSEVTILSGQNSEHTTNNVREEPSAGGSGPQDLRKNSEETGSSSGSSPSHKRSQLDDNNEEHARAEVGVSRKRTKLSSLRFICCFHNGPGRKCSGTDETISEVLKKLSEQHDTHVCDRCWVLKVKDESSGLHVHPDGGQTCDDHCLSPQCHKTTPTVGHRHLFDPKTCGTKTSRVRPGDSEAVYRFIFRLVHPDLDCPSSVLTAEHSLHLDAVPRQSRRKLNREELTARANDLETRLEAGEQQNLANASRFTELQQELADAHRATKAAEEKNAALEKQTRRIIAMLSDALRTGLFMDLPEHQSLLRRVEEDAPCALVHQERSLLTPSASDRSRNSSTAPVSGGMMGQNQFSRPAMYEESAAAPIAPLESTLIDPSIEGYASEPWAGDLAWLDIFDEPGDSDVIHLQGDRW